MFFIDRELNFPEFAANKSALIEGEGGKEVIKESTNGELIYMLGESESLKSANAEEGGAKEEGIEGEGGEEKKISPKEAEKYAFNLLRWGHLSTFIC